MDDSILPMIDARLAEREAAEAARLRHSPTSGG